ncbi:MAG: hypothetical protein WAP03_29580 [Methylorubrum rhodinum]|uniref:hypothetical protein n=1 Tax=Methylorubrum rhodinum TaxID=29428 RepID=UPI003BB15562
MPPAERLRQILPFAMAVYLAASVAQFQAVRPSHVAPRGVSIESLVAGLKWHMLEMAKNEQAGMTLGFPGN